MKKQYRILFFSIGIIGVVVLGITSKPSELDWRQAFRPQMLLLFAVMLLLWAAIYAIHTAVFRLTLLEDAGRISFFRMMTICISGLSLNNVTPAGLVGGEPYRIMELKQYCGIKRAASATLMNSLLYAMGHAMLWATGSLIYVLKGFPGDPFMSTVVILAGVLSATVVILFLNSKKRGFVMPFMKFGSRLPLIGKQFKKWIRRDGDMFDDIDDCIAQFRQHPKNFRNALLMEYSSRLLEGMEYYLILLFLGERVMPWDGVFVMSVASLLGNLLFMIPMQAGTREGGTTMAVVWLGINSAAGLMTGLIYRIRDLMCTFVGILLILVNKKKNKDAAETPEIKPADPER